ncbi:uncharacterized protein LOC112347995 isoform X1 [Selaginella moellendorffii]|uniref:uncharacterized protein LOC112347995 isoform X1 n=1 Tax=Selaginella moellendorffii TaxID=88036 RepID=UPI000D1CED9C|nr:uncharacterized protein LOC112347995 isoform X1 [Selaginella moellendorffii]|eukprot:XP_024535592.1 uncharacterized protein LOC112347995 isoform X1 [Selaginella moellendorffii]
MATMGMALDGAGAARASAARLSRRLAPAEVSASGLGSFRGANISGGGARSGMRFPRAGKVLEDLSLCQVLAEKSASGGSSGDDKVEKEGFWSRISRAWKILFPPRQAMSNAQLAKRRLKMILISDRCSVTDEAKRKILDNIVGALADFVEIESEDKVELNVSSNSELGTLYYVTVPVRRVRPEFQDYSKDMESSWCLESSGLFQSSSPE